MRRSLVLTDEAARHPFLASLPPHVRRANGAEPARKLWRLTKQDVRDFAASYCACLVAVSLFIS